LVAMATDLSPKLALQLVTASPLFGGGGIHARGGWFWFGEVVRDAKAVDSGFCGGGRPRGKDVALDSRLAGAGAGTAWWARSVRAAVCNLVVFEGGFLI
jgi:hypothetical protein